MDKPRHTALDRRTFLRRTPAGLIVLAGTLQGCGSTEVAGPSEQPNTKPADPATAGIRGPTWARLQSGGRATLRYSSEFSSANAKDPTWTWKGPSGQAGGPSNGGTLSLEVDATGSWTVELTVVNEDGSATTGTIVTDVRSPFSLASSSAPLVWLTVEDPTTTEVLLHTAPHPDLLPRKSLPMSPPGTNGIGWSPDGTSLVMCGGGGKLPQLFSVDPETAQGASLASTGGVMWGPSYSHSGEWILCTDDSRIIAADEPILVRPDGSEVRYVTGDLPDPSFYGLHASWSADGENFALGSVRFPAEQPWRRRIGIFGDLFGKPDRAQLNSEESLATFFQANRIHLGSVVVDDVFEGANGCAWSPSGAWIAYSVALNPHSFDAPGHALVIAPADGSGQLQLLDWSEDVWTIISEPVWAPDESMIYYGKGTRLFRIQAGGGPPEDLVSSRGTVFDKMGSVANWA